MMHTCVARSTAAALAAAEGPLVAYQKQFLDLNDRTADARTVLSPREKRDLARYAAGKYAAERGLVGGFDDVAARLEDLGTMGVDEVACLLDFGLPDDAVTETLTRLAPFTR
jgi:alkanesulfonate monooxygenase SsuD/methylene tetrahydromethanopterin reductase-like flavin-dependent oxidoreductase (luciferase family)